MDEKKELYSLDKTVKPAMTAYVNGVRSEQDLEACRQIFSDAGDRFSSMEGATPEMYIRYFRIRNMIDLGDQIFVSAFDRTNSIGPHFRSDEEFSQQLHNQMVDMGPWA